MNALLLLLLDSRAPAGGHNHSGGMEAAIGAGWVRDLADVEAFCRGRLRTSGRVAAAFAGAACELWLTTNPPASDRGATAGTQAPTSRSTSDGPAEWARLDAELDARMPSEALRAASRQLGNGLRRLLRAMRPDAGLGAPWAAGPAPHHPLVLGAGVALAGGHPRLAADAAALGTVSGPASAAVRLLGLDPFAVHAMLARLAEEIDRGAFAAPGAVDPPRSRGAWPADLPADSAPALDLLADFHLTTEVRLFAS